MGPAVSVINHSGNPNLDDQSTTPLHAGTAVVSAVTMKWVRRDILSDIINTYLRPYSIGHTKM